MVARLIAASINPGPKATEYRWFATPFRLMISALFFWSERLFFLSNEEMGSPGLKACAVPPLCQTY
jgi:hypothetical protein